MEAIGKFNNTRIPLPLSLRYPQPPCSPPFSSLSFRTPPPPFSPSSIKASSSSNPLLPKFQNPNPQTPNQFSSSLIKTTLIAAVTATALFFARFNLKPLIAAPVYPPATVETDAEDEISDEEKARHVEEYLRLNPNNIDALRVLVELRVRNRKVKEAIPVIEQMISLDPNDLEFPLAKAHMHIFAGEHKLAKLGFEQVLSKDPLCVEAYHGLVIAASETDSISEMKQVERRILEGIEKCKKEKKKDELREFRLLLAQTQVLEGVYDDALKIYEELVKEEPRDFRPYLCEGIIYTLLSKREEAEKCFKKYRRLVPKGHPYAKYFDNNMVEKLFSKKVDLNTKAKLERVVLKTEVEEAVEDERDSSKIEVEAVEDERDSSKIEDGGDPLKIEEQTVEDERHSSKIEEQTVEYERDSSKIEEQVVEDERVGSKNEEQENEKASYSDSEEQIVRSE